MIRRVIILGSTGSIGTQAIGVIEHLNALARRGDVILEERDRQRPAREKLAFEIVGLAAGGNAALLAEQARRLGVRHTAIASESCPGSAHDKNALPPGTRRGRDAAEQLVREVECDIVVAAIVGVAGLAATLAAVELGRDVALANKETLVAAGSLMVAAAAASGSKLLPVDSEHSALWQCLLGAARHDNDRIDPPLSPGSGKAAFVRRAILTASGGPFREWSIDRIALATPADALKHPTWSMGAKITIDCATLMNKSLELVEASWLFGLRAEQLGMVVHPQSLVHALVETIDGATLAQLATPDMCLPIQLALTHPVRRTAPTKPLDFSTLGRLDFEPVDTHRFPAATLWQRVLGMNAGTTMGAILNAANEEAVRAYLDPAASISFPRIGELVAEALDAIRPAPLCSLEGMLDADRTAREFVNRRCSKVGTARLAP